MAGERMAQIDYWQDKPQVWLLDEALDGMTPEEFMGYFWIRQRGRVSDPPGVFANDDGLLGKWSRLKPAAWRRAEKQIKAMFALDDHGYLHDEGTKNEYLSFIRLCHERKNDAKRKAFARWTDKKQQKTFKDEPFIDPYRDFPSPSHPAVGRANLQNNLFGPKMPMHAGAMQQHAPAGGIDRLTEGINLSDGAAPPASTAAASPGPPEPPLSQKLKQAMRQAQDKPTPEEFRTRQAAFQQQIEALEKADAQREQAGGGT